MQVGTRTVARQYKWLDLAAFARMLLPGDHEVVSVKYFTACTLTYPHDNAAIERQNIPRDLPARCQLPDVIPYGKHGDRFIRRPNAWK